MSITMYTFDLRIGVLTGSRPAQVVGGKELTVCAGATPVAPPADIPTGHAARWTGSAWEVVEDHRQHMDSKGTKTGGTPFWIPAKGDDWQSPPRYTEDLGPLPEGAVTERPEKPAPTEKELFATLRAARDVRLAEYDTLMAQLARWLRIATTESATTALYAKIAELDTWAEALCALPSADGAPWDGGGENTPWPEQPNVLGTE